MTTSLTGDLRFHQYMQGRVRCIQPNLIFQPKAHLNQE